MARQSPAGSYPPGVQNARVLFLGSEWKALWRTGEEPVRSSDEKKKRSGKRCSDAPTSCENKESGERCPTSPMDGVLDGVDLRGISDGPAEAALDCVCHQSIRAISTASAPSSACCS